MLFTQRNIDIFKAVLEGDSYGTIGKRYDVSRQRIEQLFKHMISKMRIILEGKDEHGLSVIFTCPSSDAYKMKLDVVKRHKDFYLTEINKIQAANSLH